MNYRTPQDLWTRLFAKYQHEKTAAAFKEQGIEIPPMPEEPTEADRVRMLAEADAKKAEAQKETDLIDEQMRKLELLHAQQRVYANRLPEGMRNFYMRSGTIRTPIKWMLSFPLVWIVSYLNMGWLMLRNAVGFPLDVISLRRVLYLPDPLDFSIKVLNPGGEVIVPPGTYERTARIEAVSNLKLRGSGRSTVIKAANSSNLNELVYIAPGREYMSFEGIHFDTNATNQTSGFNRIFRVEGNSSNTTRGLKVLNCTFTGPDSVQASEFGLGFSGSDLDSIHDVEISGCTAWDWKGASIVHMIGVKRARIHDNVWRGPVGTKRS